MITSWNYAILNPTAIDHNECKGSNTTYDGDLLPYGLTIIPSGTRRPRIRLSHDSEEDKIFKLDDCVGILHND